jgi:hypothetical protein
MSATHDDRNNTFKFLATIIMMNKESISYTKDKKSPFDYTAIMREVLSRRKGGLRTYLANPKNPGSIKKAESAKLPQM